MTDAPPAGDDERVLVLAPRGRDAAVVAQVLAPIGLATVACATPAALVAQLDAGAGLALLTEESLDAAPGLAALTRWLAAQPPWSDLPVIVLASKQTGRRSARALATL